MKVAAMFGDGTAGLVDKDDPVPKGDIVVVKVLVAPMCTEYKAFRDRAKADCLGHEAAGEVAAVAQPGRVKVGDRVVVQPQCACGACALCLRGEHIHCQHGQNPVVATGSKAGIATYAQYLLKPDWLLTPIPEGMSTRHAAMACCGLGPTFGAMQRMAVDAFDTVLITGLGPVGLGGVINGRYRGARVIGIDSVPYRRRLAEELGAEATFDPADPDILAKLQKLTGGVGVDKAIDCAGAPQAQRLLLDALRRRGQLSFVGEAGELTVKVGPDLLRKGLSLHGIWHYSLADAPRLLQTIAAVGPQLDKLVTHSLPMSRVQDAWQLQLTGNCGKVLLDPWA